MMKKVQKVLIGALCLAIGAGALVACGDDTPTNPDGGNKVTVTFYDGTSRLSQINVDKGGVVTPPENDPVKNGYDFVRWCATPTYSQVFDFSKPIDKNTSVYAGFRSTVADDHTWYLAGSSGVSDLFAESGDYKEFKGDKADDLPESITFVKDAEKGNRFTFTHDFYEADKFQILNTVDGWGDYQIGYGYIAPEQYSIETTAPMYHGGGLSGMNKTSDVIVGQSGNYTITLDVDADGKLTEFSYNRNGDAAEVEISYTDYFIKGESITSWEDMYNDTTRMSRKGDMYSLSIYLKQGDKFMFTSRITTEDGVRPGTLYIKANALDEDSKTYVDGTDSDMVAKSDGTYKFTYDAEKGVLTVDFDAQTTPEQHDYYLDGKFGENNNWGDFQNDPDSFKLTAKDNGIYTMESVELNVDDELVVCAYAAGEDELTWGNMASKYNFEYFKPDTDAFAAADIDQKNYNIKVVKAGTYDISFNSYSRMIQIKVHNDSPDIYDIYLKGLNVVNSESAESSWSHNFSDGWKMTVNADNTAYEMTVTVKSGAEFCLARYSKGATAGNGDTVKASDLNDASNENLNATFTSANNFKYTGEEDITVKIVYTIATGKVDIVAVQAE